MSAKEKLEFKKNMLKSLAEMLKMRGIITEDECRKIKNEFNKIAS